MTPQMTLQSSGHCRRSRSSWSPLIMLMVGLMISPVLPMFLPCCWAFQILHCPGAILGCCRDYREADKVSGHDIAFQAAPAHLPAQSSSLLAKGRPEV